MLKRFLPLLLAAVLIPSLATAQSIIPPWKTQNLSFVYQRALGGYLTNTDSSTVCYSGVAGSDTSTAFDLRSANYRGPMTWWHATQGAITDTTAAFALTFRTSDYAAATGLDSIDVTVQVSPDNATWTSLDTLGVSSKLRFTLASSGSQTQTLYTTSQGIGTDRLNWDRNAANFVRFIVKKDPNSTGYKYGMSIAARIYQ